MNISLRGAAAAAPERALSYTEIKKRQEAAQALAAERKRKVEIGALEARSSPRMEATSRIKAAARDKLISIRERIEILKKLYGANPKEMARALAQVFKELKEAVKAYKDAGGQEMAMAGESARVVLASDAAEETAAAEDGQAGEKVQAEDAPAKTGAGLYDEMVRTLREDIGRDGLDFTRQVRGLIDKIKELLEASRGQAMIRKPDKDTDAAFEAADKALKELGEALDDMDKDIMRAVPAAGMMVSLAA